MSIKVLCINPGGTSTKIAVFEDETAVYKKSIAHSIEALKDFKTVQSQLLYRYELICEELDRAGIEISELDAVVGRGGSFRVTEGGVFEINKEMLDDCKSGRLFAHPSNLGCQLAVMFADPYGLPAYVVDPPNIDEFEDIARISGFSLISRESSFHALNEKNTAERIAKQIGKEFSKANIITTHLGSGVSVTAHKLGKSVDNTYGSGGDGPFSPERSGRLPALSLLQAIEDSHKDRHFWQKTLTKHSGMVSYFGTNDMMRISRQMECGDSSAAEMIYAFAHTIAKEIAGYATILDWNVDGIGITGAIANNEYITSVIKNEVSFIAPVYVFAGEFEMEAMAMGAMEVINGKKETKIYHSAQ